MITAKWQFTPKIGKTKGSVLKALTAKIEAMIAARGLKPGDRLPTERALAVELGVSRSRLREAMQPLISRGVIRNRQGGGTYVADAGRKAFLDAALQPLGGLARLDAGYWRDVMEIRNSLDADAGYFAALRASEGDRARLVSALEAVTERDGIDPARQADADAAFHMVIAEASQNAVLRQIVAGLFELMRISIAESLTQLFRLPKTAETLDAQHRRIVEAILAGEADKARAAVLEHLSFVEAGLKQLEEEAARARRADQARVRISKEEAKP